MDPGRARASTAPPSSAAAPSSASPSSAVPGDAVDDDWVPDLAPVPWHLKMLAGVVALYLGWRAFQGIEWLVHRF